MIKKAIVRIPILMGVMFLSGCAPVISGVMNAAVDENAVYEKTAKYFGVSRDSIIVSSIEKGALATAYRVKYAGRLYNCSIYYGTVDCKQPGGGQGDLIGSTGASIRTAVPAVPNSSVMTPAQAQVRLNQLGYQVGVADGVFGKKSIEKLKLFQKSRGLAASGTLDDPTVNALR